jgi:hypothetical protein
MVEGGGWLAWLRLEDPPGLSPVTTVGRFDTVEAAQVGTDDGWVSRGRQGVRVGPSSGPGRGVPHARRVPASRTPPPLGAWVGGR